MVTPQSRHQYLVSLPPRMAEAFARLEHRPFPDWFAVSDPPATKLGSGGGTAHLLVEAWRAAGPERRFRDWLRSGRRILIHGGGQSRRVPAYAAVGKPLMPVPVLRWSRGQRLEQSLLDLQLPAYDRVLRHAPATFPVLITSGDVLLRFGRDLPVFPEADVLGLGMWVTPERAKDFGVFFAPRERPDELAFFLQKPPAAQLRELAAEHVWLVDTGMWLLSERAVMLLLTRCGWDEDRQRFRCDQPEPYELYADFGLALGSTPTVEDAEVRDLRCGVVPLPRPEFYHFGTSRQMIESVSALQNLELDETKLGLMGARRHPDQYLQNSAFAFPLRHEENHTLWVENCTIPSTWRLACRHVLTGITAVEPADGVLRLEPGVCLDFAPVEGGGVCIRFYGLDDPGGGVLKDDGTRWLGRPALQWFEAHGVDPARAGLLLSSDIHEAALFPVVKADSVSCEFVQWLVASEPDPKSPHAETWTRATRLSARRIPEVLDAERLYLQRARYRQRCLRPMLENARWSVFLKLDLDSAARLFAETGTDPAGLDRPKIEGLDPMQRVHLEMFRGAVVRHRQGQGPEIHERAAFARLRDLILGNAALTPFLPTCAVQEDQIVWGRSPVRLDLAGGWTDTPPYCLEHGGRVLNVAVDLNGQPPIQVFARVCRRPELVLRSIDLGAEERVRTYEELGAFGLPGSEFGVAKAALAMAGFLPQFNAAGGARTLREQLEAFGGGLEVSLLAAVPKGSGLGTSSILAATILATIGDLCGLQLDRQDLFLRTLALEQVLTTGGGWQDQAGGIYRGVKLVETSAGWTQRPTLRWLPDHLFERESARQRILLYYTGLTRLAKNILQEIVRGIFLNSPAHLGVIEEIAENAEIAFNAIQRSDYAGMAEAVRNSWRLNQALDAGTNPPGVQAILERVGDCLLGAKLLGAGGGGYLLMLAKDETAGARVRETLSASPPNPRARFVEFSLSDTGLQVTRS